MEVPIKPRLGLLLFTRPFLYQPFKSQYAAMSDSSCSLSPTEYSSSTITLAYEAQSTNTTDMRLVTLAGGGSFLSKARLVYEGNDAIKWSINTEGTLSRETTIRKPSTGELLPQLLSPSATAYLVLGHPPLSGLLAEIEWSLLRDTIRYLGEEVRVKKKRAEKNPYLKA